MKLDKNYSLVNKPKSAVNINRARSNTPTPTPKSATSKQTLLQHESATSYRSSYSARPINRGSSSSNVATTRSSFNNGISKVTSSRQRPLTTSSNGSKSLGGIDYVATQLKRMRKKQKTAEKNKQDHVTGIDGSDDHHQQSDVNTAENGSLSSHLHNNLFTARGQLENIFNDLSDDISVFGRLREKPLPTGSDIFEEVLQEMIQLSVQMTTEDIIQTEEVPLPAELSQEERNSSPAGREDGEIDNEAADLDNGDKDVQTDAITSNDETIELENEIVLQVDEQPEYTDIVKTEASLEQV